MRTITSAPPRETFSAVAAKRPELRRTYLPTPWPHLWQADESVASVAVEREYRGEPGVFFGFLRGAERQPLTELAARSWAGSGSAGYLVVGAQDTEFGRQQQVVAAAASAAGLPVTVTEVPGGHAWPVGAAGFDQGLPWLTTRLGLTP